MTKSPKFDNLGADFLFEFSLLQKLPKRERSDMLIRGLKQFLQVKTAIETLINNG
jgi:hypothetical protein